MERVGGKVAKYAKAGVVRLMINGCAEDVQVEIHVCENCAKSAHPLLCEHVTSEDLEAGTGTWETGPAEEELPPIDWDALNRAEEARWASKSK